MKTKNKILITGVLLAVSQVINCQSQSQSKMNASGPEGKCWGVVGPGEGDCGGKDPKTGDTWSCAGQNPTADLGWKKMSKGECDALPKHKNSKEKKFVANT